MGKVLMDEETQIEITHSKLGILSTMLSFMTGSYISALYLIFLTYSSIKFKTFDSNLIFSQAINSPINISILSAGLGIVISLLGLLGKYKKRFYPLVGLMLNLSLVYFTFQFIKMIKKL